MDIFLYFLTFLRLNDSVINYNTIAAITILKIMVIPALLLTIILFIELTADKNVHY